MQASDAGRAANCQEPDLGRCGHEIHAAVSRVTGRAGARPTTVDDVGNRLLSAFMPLSAPGLAAPFERRVSFRPLRQYYHLSPR